MVILGKEQKMKYKDFIQNSSAINFAKEKGIPAKLKLKLFPAMEAVEKIANWYNLALSEVNEKFQDVNRESDKSKQDAKSTAIKELMETDVSIEFKPACTLEWAMELMETQRENDNSCADIPLGMWIAAKNIGIFE